MAIDTTLNEYDEALPLWEQTRAAIKGKIAVKALKLADPAYKVTADNCDSLRLRREQYWDRARYFNATGQTHVVLGGMIYSEPPEVVLPTQLEYLLTNASGDTGINQIIQDVVDDQIAIGRYGCLVDMPSNDGGLTIQQLTTSKLLPQIIQYQAESIISWREDGKLQEVRLLESYTEFSGDDLDWEVKPQIRRLVLIDGIYTNQIWREDEQLNSVTPKMNGKTMDFIPFYFFGSDANTSDISKPPMFDIGDYNIGHFILDADNRENLHFHGQGMTNVFTELSPVEFKEANPDGLNVGAKGVNQLGANDKVELLQLEATGAISKEMKEDEKRMIMLGAQLVLDSNSNTTLGAKEMEFSVSTSTLKRISINTSMGAEQLIQWCADFLKASGEIVYQLNKDFVTDGMDSAMVANHLNAVVQGVLPSSTFNETARATGMTDKTDDKINKDLEDEAFKTGGTTEEEAAEQARIDTEKEAE